MIRTATIALPLIATWLAFAPVASANPIGECRSICSHLRGDYQACYDNCLRR